MSAPVDVLAVMDDMASTVQLVSAEHKAWHARIVAARAAVTELIEAAKDCESLLSELEDGGAENPELHVLRVALARVGGAK